VGRLISQQRGTLHRQQGQLEDLSSDAQPLQKAPMTTLTCILNTRLLSMARGTSRYT